MTTVAVLQGNSRGRPSTEESVPAVDLGSCLPSASASLWSPRPAPREPRGTPGALTGFPEDPCSNSSSLLPSCMPTSVKLSPFLCKMGQHTHPQPGALKTTRDKAHGQHVMSAWQTICILSRGRRLLPNADGRAGGGASSDAQAVLSTWPSLGDRSEGSKALGVPSHGAGQPFAKNQHIVYLREGGLSGCKLLARETVAR